MGGCEEEHTYTAQQRSWPTSERSNSQPTPPLTQPEDYLHDQQNDPGEHDILTRQLAYYLHLLPAAQQEVVRSVYLQEQTLQEIADRLQVPLGTIKSRLRLGLAKLREQIEQEHKHD